MKYKLHSRRMFLQGAGSLLPIPFLSSMLPRELWAQANPIARRYIVISTGYDYGRHENWWPTLTQPTAIFNPGNGDKSVRHERLQNYITGGRTNLSRIFSSQLNPHLNSINIIKGLDHPARYGHGSGPKLGDYRRNSNPDTDPLRQLSPIRTIDQVLNDSIIFNPARRDVAVIGHSGSTSSKRLADGTIVSVQSIGRGLDGIYNYFFNGVRETTGGTAPPPNPRVDLLTGVMDDYRRIRNGRQISAVDRTNLDSAMDKLNDIQNSLRPNQPVVGQCRHLNISRAGDGDAFFTNPATMRVFADLLSAAVMCDVARTFIVQMEFNENMQNVYDFHPTEDFHNGHSHRPFDVLNGLVNWQHMGNIHNELVRYFLAPLLDRLAGATDPANNQSYLYNSLVHYSTEASQVHGFNSYPCFLAGNAGGNLRSGNFLDYTDHAQPHSWVADGYVTDPNSPQFSHEYVGVPYNRLFNTILQSMGLSRSDYEDPNLNSFLANRTDNYFGARNNNIANVGGYGHWGASPTAYSNAGPERQRNRYSQYDFNFFKSVLPMPG